MAMRYRPGLEGTVPVFGFIVTPIAASTTPKGIAAMSKPAMMITAARK